MAMQYIERVLKQLGEADLAEDIALKRKQFVRRGHGSDIPLPQETRPVSTRRVTPRLEAPTVYPEIPLEAVWQRQSQNFLELGFHVETGFEGTDEGKQAYLDSLPKFEPQPEEYKGRLDTPLLVETRVGIDRQYELARVTSYLKEASLDVQNWPQDPKGYKTAESPYATWTNDPAKNRNRNVEDVRKNLAEDERGGTRFDGAALYIANPKKLNEVYIDLPGDSVESGSAPDLYLFSGRPHLSYRWVGYAGPQWGSLVCGRE